MSTSLVSRNGKWILLVVSVLMLAILACGPAAPQPTPTPFPPTPTPVPPTPIPPTNPPAPQPAGGTASVQIVNQSGTTICYVYISPSTDTQWGDDQLGSGNVIAAGDSFTITDIPAGTYDFRADDCSGNTLAEEYGVTLPGGPFTWTVSGTGSSGGTGSTGGTGGSGSLTVINSSSVTICYLYVSPSTDTSWGDDQLGSSVIDPGQSFTITDIPFGTYDLRAEDCSGGNSVERSGVQISGAFEWTITD
jgi:hypothetical protein